MKIVFLLPCGSFCMARLYDSGIPARGGCFCRAGSEFDFVSFRNPPAMPIRGVLLSPAVIIDHAAQRDSDE